jgi:hypothetical protein
MRRTTAAIIFALASIGPLGWTIEHAVSSAAFANPSQQVAGGGVVVTATLLTDRVGGTAIKVEMNTHAVSLDAYKFEEIVFLRDDSGKEYPLEAVDKPSGGGHHREAVLRFATLAPEVKMIELIVRDVAGVNERAFRWPIGE